MSAENQLSGLRLYSDTGGVRPTTELESEQALPARMLLEELDDDGDEDIFFGPVTNKEKLKSKKMRRKTEVFRPGFRAGWDKEEEQEQEDGGEGMSEEPTTGISSSGSSGNEAIEMKDINSEKPGDCGNSDSDTSSSVSLQNLCSTEGSINSSANQQSNEEGSEEDSKITKDLFTQHTPSPTEMRIGSSESSINVNTPPFSLVTVSPQVDTTVFKEDNSTFEGVELFNATECISIGGYDSTADETDQDGSMRNEEIIIPEGTGVGSLYDKPIDANQRQCEDVTSKSDFSEVGNAVNTEELCSSADKQMGPAAVAKPTPCKTSGHCSVIYSSPVLISTSVQKVQMQQSLCYGNSISHVPTSITNFNKMGNLVRGSDFADQVDYSSSQGTNVAPSAFNPTGHSAFGKPTTKIDDMASSLNKGITRLHHLPLTPGSTLQSPVLNIGCYNHATNNHQGHCTLPSSMLHKENVNPDRQPNTVIVASDSTTKIYKVLSAVSSPVVSALCSQQPSQPGPIEAQPVPSPRVLQLSNRQAPAASPSAAARQRLIDEKRALLTRLRAEKQELRQRIKEDNEKCFNMKLENAAALQSNMARGMTPFFDRLPSQGCNGPAALTLTERELEVVTKLHTIRNSQHTSSDRTQSPCQQAIHHRGQSRLHWHQDLIMNTEELSSPSRPRCTAKTILSKKGHNSVRRGNGLQVLSSSSSLHSGQPRARQHLLF